MVKKKEKGRKMENKEDNIDKKGEREKRGIFTMYYKK